VNLDIRSLLPSIIPKAIVWAEQVAAEVLHTGIGLNTPSLSIAARVGVARPEMIRLSMVKQLPFPSDPQLQQAAITTGLLGPGMAGLTLGYAIFICEGHNSPRLLSHECRHVYQYEMCGSIAAFLPIYLQQIVDFGYMNAPFEIDAQKHELIT
jgi:hypothetical protein